MTGACGDAVRARLVDGREGGRPDAAAVPAQRVQRDQVGQPPHLRAASRACFAGWLRTLCRKLFHWYNIMSL